MRLVRAAGADQGEREAVAVPQDRQRLEQPQVVLVRERHRRVEQEPLGQAVRGADPGDGLGCRGRRRERRPDRDDGDLAGVDAVLPHDVVLGVAGAGDDQPGTLAALAVDPVAPGPFAVREQLRQVAVLEVERLVDEREGRLEVDGVREVDDAHAARPEHAVGLRRRGRPGQRSRRVPPDAVRGVHPEAEAAGPAVDALPAPGHGPERGVRDLGERPGQHVLAVARQPAEVRGVPLGREHQEALVGAGLAGEVGQHALDRLLGAARIGRVRPGR